MSSRPQTADLYEENDEPDLGPDERDLDLMDGSWEREYYSGRMKTRNWNAIGAGIGILITDHNVRETLGIVDRAYLIFEGKVRRHGTKDFLVNDDEARRLYLGQDFSM